MRYKAESGFQNEQKIWFYELCRHGICKAFLLSIFETSKIGTKNMASRFFNG